MLRKIIILLLVFSLTLVYAEANIKWFKKKPQKETIYFEPLEAIDGRAFYIDKDILLYDSLKKACLHDAFLKNSFAQLQQTGCSILLSSDSNIRIISWPARSSYCNNFTYRHLVQYRVAPNKTRSFPAGWNTGRRTNTCFDSFRSTQSTTMHAVRHVRDGIYLLETGIDKEHRLFALDIGRGIMKDAYVFVSDERKPINTITFETESMCRDSQVGCKLNDECLQIPQLDSLGCFSGNYDSLRFNGSFFDKDSAYMSYVQELTERKCRIARSYYKDGNNNRVIHKICKGCPFTLQIEVRYDQDTYFDEKPFKVKFTTNKSKEEEECDLINESPMFVEFPLMAVNKYVFVENFNPYALSELGTDSITGTDQLLKVLCVVGKEQALTYEWLRYTAVAFNCQPSDEEYTRIQWVLVVDEKLQYLDEQLYKGNQIDLQMREEWAGKTIQVIPYIKNCTIDTHIKVETKVNDE